jgi:uncharacterized membrane-anchored protein YhcB (DUF1043 family)
MTTEFTKLQKHKYKTSNTHIFYKSTKTAMATKLLSTQSKDEIRKVSPGDRQWGHDPGGRMDVKEPEKIT